MRWLVAANANADAIAVKRSNYRPTKSTTAAFSLGTPLPHRAMQPKSTAALGSRKTKAKIKSEIKKRRRRRRRNEGKREGKRGRRKEKRSGVGVDVKKYRDTRH